MKRLVITGSSGFLGSALVKDLAGEYEIIAVDKSCPQQALDNVTYLKGDFCEEDFLDEVIRHSMRDNKASLYGFIHVGAMNSAVETLSGDELQVESVLDQDVNSWRMMFEINVFPLLLIFKKFYPLLSDLGTGRFVFFSSTYGHVAPPAKLYRRKNGDVLFFKDPSYGMSKAALESFVKYLASFYGNSGVTFNAVAPGGIFNKQDSEFVQNYSAMCPAGRMGQPDDIFSAVRFLLATNSGYVNGTSVMIDGGWTNI